jgi:hypothetical protein
MREMIAALLALAFLVAGCTGRQADRTTSRLQGDDDPDYTVH